MCRSSRGTKYLIRTKPYFDLRPDRNALQIANRKLLTHNLPRCQLPIFALSTLPTMFYRLLGFIFLFTTTSATAQPLSKKQQRAIAKEDALIVENLRRHIAVLAHDSLEGRRTGTAGEQKTINYLTAYYTSLGLQPAGTAGYVQPFEVDEGKTFAAANHCTIDNIKLEAGTDYFPLPYSAEGEVKTKSPVSLQEAGEAWWFDLKDDLIAQQNNPHFMAEEAIRTKAAEAAKQGATALLVFNSSAAPDNVKYNGKDRSNALAIPILFFTNSGVQKIGLNVTSSPDVDARVAFEQRIRKGSNVAALLNNKAAQTLVIGAHLDHLGYGEDHNSRHTGAASIHNGADDNASGTAAVMELARLLGGMKNLPFNVLFLHFSGEELGLYGSKWYVEHPTVPLNTVRYMINMDMVGRLDVATKTLTVGGVGTSPAWPHLTAAAKPAYFNVKVDSSGTGPSDHTSFYRKDLPVLFLFTGLHLDYHKPDDDADRINYEGEKEIVRYVQRLVQATKAEEAMAFTKTKEQSMGTGRFKVSIGIMPDYTYSGQGVKADGVIEGRPAQKAGMQAGDVIIQLGEHLVTSVETYMAALNRFDKGVSTTVTIKRGEQVMELPIVF